MLTITFACSQVRENGNFTVQVQVYLFSSHNIHIHVSGYTKDIQKYIGDVDAIRNHGVWLMAPSIVTNEVKQKSH